MENKYANPAPLGLMGFGMTTILLNIHNAGFFPVTSIVLAMGIFYGGLAQIVAGAMEWRKNNTFGMTAFSSYGFFWLILVALIVMPKLGWAEATSKAGMAWFLSVWGFFTLLLFVGTLKLSRSLQVVFASLTLLLFLLAIGETADNPGLKSFTGFEGIFCGLSACYTGVAQVLNELYKRTVMPLGLVKR